MVNWRIRIHYTRILIRGSGSGSGLTSNGSETLLFFLFRIWQYSNGRVVGKVDYKDNRGGPPTPLIFAKITTVDLSETGSWTYRKLVCGPIGIRFVDLLETGLWTYRKPVRGPMRKPVRGPMRKLVRGPMRKPVCGGIVVWPNLT